MSVTTKLWRVAVLALFTSGLDSVNAEQIPPRMNIVLEEGPQWQKCELTRQSIEGAAKAALRYNRIEYSNVTLIPYLYIVVNTAYLDGLCVSSIDVQIRRFDRWPKSDGQYYQGHFTYCESGSLLTGPGHADRVLASLQRHVNTCLGAIGSDDTGNLVREIDQYANNQAVRPPVE